MNMEMHNVALIASVTCGVLVGRSEAGAIRSGFNTTALHADSSDADGGTGENGDDGSKDPVAIGFPVNYAGTTYSELYVNGNVTFGEPFGDFIPQTILKLQTGG